MPRLLYFPLFAAIALACPHALAAGSPTAVSNLPVVSPERRAPRDPKPKPAKKPDAAKAASKAAQPDTKK